MTQCHEPMKEGNGFMPKILKIFELNHSQAALLAVLTPFNIFFFLIQNICRI